MNMFENIYWTSGQVAEDLKNLLIRIRDLESLGRSAKFSWDRYNTLYKCNQAYENYKEGKAYRLPKISRIR